MPKNLFFVESIYSPLEGNESVVTLLSTVNEEDDFFYGYTAHLPIDKDWIKTLADIFSQAVYPTVWLDIYKEHFLGDEKYKKRFEEVVRENGITLPSVMIV